MSYRKPTPELDQSELEAAILTRLARRGSLMDGGEMRQFSRTHGTHPEHVRSLLKKLGYELSYTINSRPIWKRASVNTFTPPDKCI